MTLTKTSNPFRAIHSNAWADPIDVPSLNAGVSDFLSDRIEELRSHGDLELAHKLSCAVLLLGQAGIGKTHLFARLRKRIGPRAVFALSRPELGLEPSSRHVLGAIVRSLQMPILHDDEHRQADLIVGTAFAFLEPDPAGRKFPLVALDDWKRRPEQAREDAIGRIVDALEKVAPNISVHYAERLLRLPFEPKQEQRALFVWLAGREPSQEELSRIRESGMLDDMELMRALQTLGAMALFGTPIVLVFDQLENLCEEMGKSDRIAAYAKLISELRDGVPGFLIVQMALDSEWDQRIHPALGAGYASRVEENILRLSMPTEQERRDLIQCWWANLLSDEQRSKPFPFPFKETDVEHWARDKSMTPRMLMQACGDAYRRAQSPDANTQAAGHLKARQGPVQSQEQRLLESLRRQWEESLSEAGAAVDEASSEGRGVSAEQLMSGLLALCSRLKLLAQEESSRKPVPVLRVFAAQADTPINVDKIIIVMQQIHPASFAAALRVAIKVAGEHPAILFREKAFAVPSSWETGRRQLAAFQELKETAFERLEREDIVRLLALTRFLANARSRDLSADDGRSIAYDEVVRWTEQHLSIPSWPIASLLLNARSKKNAGIWESAAPPAAKPAPVSAPPTRTDVPAAQKSKLGECVHNIIECNGIMSLERILRETKTHIPEATQALVLEELGKIPTKLLCGSIVVLKSLENLSQ